MFAARLRCVTVTPLGIDVDPDVYWMNATSSSDGRQSSIAAREVRCGGPDKLALHSSGVKTHSRLGCWKRRARNPGTSAGVVTAARARAAASTGAVASKNCGRSATVDGG